MLVIYFIALYKKIVKKYESIRIAYESLDSNSNTNFINLAIKIILLLYVQYWLRMKAIFLPYGHSLCPNDRYD